MAESAQPDPVNPTPSQDRWWETQPDPLTGMTPQASPEMAEPAGTPPFGAPPVGTPGNPWRADGTYDPDAGYASQAYPPGYAYPPMPYPAPAGGPMIPGQMCQTAYGTFEVSTKSRLAAGLLGIFLGGIGVGQFYRGNIGLGILQILVSIVTIGVGGLWGFIEGIVTLCVQPGAPLTLDSNKRLMPMN